MALDNATKIERFAQQTRDKLNGGKQPHNHLYVVVNKCGWQRRSPGNLSQIQAGLEAAGVYPEPMLPAEGLSRNEVIRYRLTQPPDYQLSAYEPRLRFKTEAGFENFLLHNFDRVPALQQFKSPQQQYSLGGNRNRIDILCRRRKTNAFVVIELKKAATANPVGQLLKYMVQVDKKLAQREAVGVEGMIISPTRNSVLQEALNGSIKNYPVRWLTFRLNLKLT